MRLDIHKILELESQGYSYSKIAAFLGVTKNMISGKMYRYKLKAKIPMRRQKKKDVFHQKEELPTTGANGKVSIIDLKNHMCRWVFDDKMFCGEDIIKGSFCSEHAKICYRER